MTMNNVFSLPRLGVADAMRLYGMTARAIRFYDERGLIVSARDRKNARCFDGVARRRLAWIAKLRAGGVSLVDIQHVLAAEDGSGHGRECAVEKLEARRAALEAELQRLHEVLADFSVAEAQPAAAADRGAANL